MNTKTALLPGEAALHNAPHIEVGVGVHCIPQQYLRYAHTRESVEAIVLDCHYSRRYPVFVCQDATGLYLQVGIVAEDNYRLGFNAERHNHCQDYDGSKAAKPLPQDKIVYGRKWRVEAKLPSSEVIQTLFLALKVAREHEVRELFRLTHKGKTTTPFNNHHDLPLLAQLNPLWRHNGADRPATKAHVYKAVEAISYDDCKVQVVALEWRASGQWLADCELKLGGSTRLPELNRTTFTLMLNDLQRNTVYFELMAYFINLSNRHVDEYFTYKGCARFSRQVDVLSIAKVSIKARRQPKDAVFRRRLKAYHYATDLTRVPRMGCTQLAKQIKKTLSTFNHLAGVPPFFEGPV